MKLSCICPVWKRPQRTIRAIESVVNQDFSEWECIFIGDGCAYFNLCLQNGVFDRYKKQAEEKGNNLIFENLPSHKGGWGSECRKYGIEKASGKYIVFLDNDDYILPGHFTHYYDFMIKNPNVDVGFFNSFIEPYNKIRSTLLYRDRVGHSEIIIKTDILKREYEVNRDYGHDWKLIEKLIRKKYIFKKGGGISTYIVKSISNKREKGID